MKRRAIMETEIKIDLALVNAKAPLCALADVILRWPGGDLTIRRCAVFEKQGEPAWATLPRLPIEKNGKKTYFQLLELSRDLKQRVLEAVLAEYERKHHAL
jgi:hypothetical protein